MKTFTDNAGRTWTVTVNVDAVRRVRGLLDVDLLEVVEGKLLERLVGDPVLLCDLVYALCKPEADAKGVTDEDFGRAMAGDAIDGATAALLEELVDFFPSARRRLLAKALGKLKAFEAMAVEAVEKRLDGPELEERMRAALAGPEDGEAPAKPPGDSSGTSPASSASPPAP